LSLESHPDCRAPADRNAGFKLCAESLGTNFSAAKARAEELNRHLDDWRTGRGAEKSLDAQPGFGTLDWVLERYFRSKAWVDKVKPRARKAYIDELRLITELRLTNGSRAGTLPVSSIDARAVDRIYDLVRDGGRGERYRQARVSIRRMARAWAVVNRLYPKIMPSNNPWKGVEPDKHKKEETVPATREEAYALAKSLANIGHPSLGVAAIAAFEWHLRPEHSIGGGLTWSDWRPAHRPNAILIRHAKTGAEVWMPLQDADGQLFFADAEMALSSLPRLGVCVVLNHAQRGLPRPYSPFFAKALVRRARRAAGLPEHVTLAACRHGGMTELGDAALSEQGVMSLSGHRTADAARLYVKHTEVQRLVAARKRRAFVEAGLRPAGVETEQGDGYSRQVIRAHAGTKGGQKLE